jgi:hypothetical protein
MAHPVEMVYKNTINDVVKCFIASLPSHIAFSMKDANESNIKQHVDDYRDLWKNYDNKLLAAISQEITHYLHYYEVFPKGSIDEFKAVYFTGRVVSRFLDAEGLSELRELNDYVTIAMLDYKLSKHAGVSRPLMRKSLRKIAKENEFESKLGVHGMYLIYKSTCNVATGVNGSKELA